MDNLAGTQTPLRRHGDEFERLPNGYYRALGRVDDTMNLGGIKVRHLDVPSYRIQESPMQEVKALCFASGPGSSFLSMHVYSSRRSGLLRQSHLGMQAPLQAYLCLASASEIWIQC